MYKRETKSKWQKGKRRATKYAQVSPVLSSRDTKVVRRVSSEQKAAWWLPGAGGGERGAPGDTGYEMSLLHDEKVGWMVGTAAQRSECMNSTELHA